MVVAQSAYNSTNPEMGSTATFLISRYLLSISPKSTVTQFASGLKVHEPWKYRPFLPEHAKWMEVDK